MARQQNREQDRQDGEQPLTREDVLSLLQQGDDAQPLHLRERNLAYSDLSYLDLRGADLQGASLRRANLRGTNLRGASLQGADLSEADLDGADLTRAHLGSPEEEHARLHRANFSYALLRELDLCNFDLTGLNLYHADLRGSDLRGATLRGADLRGADLSTALLHGPELQGALLYRGAFLRERSKESGWEETSRLQAAIRAPEPSPPLLAEKDPSDKQPLTDREAYLYGARVLLQGSTAAKIRQLFPQGFSFAHCRQLFDDWLARAGAQYSEQEVQALWIGFAHGICESYFETT